MNAGASLPWPPEAEAAEAALFDDTLVCDVLLPAGFSTRATAAIRLAQAETLLKGLAQIEDLRSEEGAEEKRGELPLLAQRMDAKLDLVLVLLGRLVRQNSEQLPVRSVRWSRNGMRMLLSEAPGIGAEGTLCVQAADWLPDDLELPATVLAVAPQGIGSVAVWLRFPTFPQGLEEALDRHLFRLHRRQIADARGRR